MIDVNVVKWKLWSVWYDKKEDFKEWLEKKVVWGFDENGNTTLYILGVIRFTRIEDRKGYKSIIKIGKD